MNSPSHTHRVHAPVPATGRAFLQFAYEKTELAVADISTHCGTAYPLPLNPGDDQ